MHNALLAHAAAHKVYKDLESQGKVRGGFGIKADGGYSLPLDPNSKADHDAVERAADFEIGWVIAPLTTGDYPKSLRDTLGDKLPKFTAEQSASLKDSYSVIWFDGYSRGFAGAIKGKCEESNELFRSGNTLLWIPIHAR
jgi:beta-glucosidase